MSKISAWLWQQQFSGGASDQVFFASLPTAGITSVPSEEITL